VNARYACRLCRRMRRTSVHDPAKLIFAVLHLGDGTIGLQVSEIAFVSRFSAFGRNRSPIHASPKLGGLRSRQTRARARDQPLVPAIVVVQKGKAFAIAR
jgi:hypothetical protein